MWARIPADARVPAFMDLSISEAVLGHPSAYILFQLFIGADRVRRRCIEMLAPKPGQRILDVGCGPAYYFPRFPPIHYHGFDTEPRYIEYAQRRFGDRGTFHCELFTERHVEELGPFDGIFLLGLLHHLDDAQCDELLSLAGRALAPGGAVVTADPCHYPEQKPFDRFMTSRDRGKFVGPKERFLDLGRKHFAGVDTELLDDVTRIPYSHIAMRLTEPRGA